MENVLEKLAWMVVPVLFSVVGYLWNTLQTTQDDIQELKTKVSLVVSEGNKVIPDLDARIAREEMKHELYDLVSANRERIAVLETKIQECTK